MFKLEDSPFDGSQLCASVEPELFFPNTPTEVQQHLDAVVHLCAMCPLKKKCLAYAKAEPGITGIWGGVYFEMPAHNVALGAGDSRLWD